MREYQAIDEGKFSPGRFDAVIEWLLTALLLFMPIAFGVVHRWSEEIVVILSGLIVISFLLKLVYHREQGVIATWAYVPLGIFLFVVILQLVSLPEAMLSVISPNTMAVKKELLGDLADADSLLKSMSLSFYPNATKYNLRLLLAITAVFVVVLNVFRHPAQIKRLLKTISLIGGFVALVALAQNVSGTDKIFWFVPLSRGDANSGPFVNHSHYGQFMNLSIGAAIGLVIVKLHEVFAGRRITPPVVFEYFSSSSARIVWLLIAIISLGAATVFISLTRGGVVSMFIAVIFTTLLFASRRSFKDHGWLIIVMALGAFICILYTGFDAVCNRIASLSELHAYKSRWQILKDVWVIFRQFPLLGTGLGTHSVVYPMFDRSTVSALSTHAENEYAQAAEETGILGLGLLVIFGIMVWSSYVRNIRNTNLPIHSAAYGLGFGLLAILVHSLSDFGQHLPANAFLSAIFCALLVGLTRLEQKPDVTVQKGVSLQNFRNLRIALLICVFGIWIWAFVGADNARSAEICWRKVLAVESGLVKKNWSGTSAEYADLISYAAKATDYQPENVEYCYWLNVYRWRSVCRAISTNTGSVIVSDDTMPLINDIVAQFHKARQLCPTFGAVYCVLGQIEKFILDDPSGAERIRKGYRLAPCDPTACFTTGLLDIAEDKIEQSSEKLKRAVQLDGRLFADVIDVYVYKADRPDLAIDIAGDDTDRLIYIINILEGTSDTGRYEDLLKNSRARVMDLLRDKCVQQGAPASVFALMAAMCRKQQDSEAAIDYYRRALSLDYSQVNWHLALAKLLADAGHAPEAIHEAKICLRLCPQSKDAEKLVADLSVHPAIVGKEIK